MWILVARKRDGGREIYGGGGRERVMEGQRLREREGGWQREREGGRKRGKWNETKEGGVVEGEKLGEGGREVDTQNRKKMIRYQSSYQTTPTNHTHDIHSPLKDVYKLQSANSRILQYCSCPQIAEPKI